MRVVKLAQPGYDVKTAGDENLIYSSLWPTLKIYKEGSATIGDTRVRTLLAGHDLGFVPFVWYYANTPASAWFNAGSIGVENRSEFMGPIGDGSINISGDKLEYLPVAFPGTTNSSQLYYYIFALDITVQYDAPIIKVGDIQGGRGGRVFKIAKPDRDLGSDNLDDFVIHSRARSPLIHSVNPSKGEVKSLVVNHNLGYLPMFFGFEKTSDGYKPIATGQGGASSFQSTENTVTFTSAAAREISIVILKDPFNVTATRQVKI